MVVGVVGPVVGVVGPVVGPVAGRLLDQLLDCNRLDLYLPVMSSGHFLVLLQWLMQ